MVKWSKIIWGEKALYTIKQTKQRGQFTPNAKSFTCEHFRKSLLMLILTKKQKPISFWA